MDRAKTGRVIHLRGPVTDPCVLRVLLIVKDNGETVHSLLVSFLSSKCFLQSLVPHPSNRKVGSL